MPPLSFSGALSLLATQGPKPAGRSQTPRSSRVCGGSSRWFATAKRTTLPTSWRAARPQGEPAWIRFDNDGTFTGQAPCNTFSGRYHFDGRVLEIPETSGTAAGCGAIDPETEAVDESVNRAETAIFEAIVGPVAMEVTFSGPDSSVTEWASLTAVLTFRRG